LRLKPTHCQAISSSGLQRPIEQDTALDAHKKMAEIIIIYLVFSAFDEVVSCFVLPEMQTGKVFNDILEATS
jgi:hypothetical protein